MRPRFICINHYTGMVNQPEQAVLMYRSAVNMAASLAMHDRWYEALLCMGCAFETAEILLDTSVIPHSMALLWYQNSLTELLVLLKRLDHDVEFQQVLQHGRARIHRENPVDAEYQQEFDRQAQSLAAVVDQLKQPVGFQPASIAMVFEAPQGPLVVH